MIYYVEDDTNIRDLTVYALRQAGFEANGYPGALEFFEACESQLPELVLLDIMMPEVDGLEILSRLREDARTKHVPIIMLTAKGTEYDKVTGLDAGADDYLAKPFGMMELLSRINALLRRATAPPLESLEVLECGDIRLSVSAHSVHVGDILVPLTLKEFEMLHMLMMNQGQVLSRGQLFEEVWGMAYMGSTRTVDVHIQTLRQKLGEAKPGAEALIHTIRGVGYSIKDES